MDDRCHRDRTRPQVCYGEEWSLGQVRFSANFSELEGGTEFNASTVFGFRLAPHQHRQVSGLPDLRTGW